MNTAQKWLIDNRLNDLILNDHDGSRSEDWIYTSDALMLFTEESKNQPTKTREGKTC